MKNLIQIVVVICMLTTSINCEYLKNSEFVSLSMPLRALFKKCPSLGSKRVVLCPFLHCVHLCRRLIQFRLRQFSAKWNY